MTAVTPYSCHPCAYVTNFLSLILKTCYVKFLKADISDSCHTGLYPRVYTSVDIYVLLIFPMVWSNILYHGLFYILLQHLRDLTVSHQTVSQVLCKLNASVRHPPFPGLVSWQKARRWGQSLSASIHISNHYVVLSQTSTRVFVKPK